MEKIIILGAGLAGLGAAKTCKEKGLNPTVLEQRETYGGLAGCFTIDGFRFDRFVHFSFANDPKVLSVFNASTQCEVYRHTPNPYNLYHGLWIKHPAQNNLYPLPKEEKEKIIADFKKRPRHFDVSKVDNYEQWLRIQFGNEFAERFPMVYTRKYWMTEARNLETKWIGNRIYQPSLDEVIKGAERPETPVTYYAKEMRYPKSGGFRQFFSILVEGTDIQYNKRVVSIDTEKKALTTIDGTIYPYDQLLSSIPLPEYYHLLKGIPEDVTDAMLKLRCTSGYHISIGLRTKDIPPYLWWYIYDEDILAARVYSPSLKSPDNVPEGCSSLQMEVYCEENEYTDEQLKAGTVVKLVELGIIKEDDILFVHVDFERYANVIFDHNIYAARKIVRDYLHSLGIITIGRFGEWDYLWTDQSLMSGMNVNF